MLVPAGGLVVRRRPDRSEAASQNQTPAVCHGFCAQQIAHVGFVAPKQLRPVTLARSAHLSVGIQAARKA